MGKVRLASVALVALGLLCAGCDRGGAGGPPARPRVEARAASSPEANTAGMGGAGQEAGGGESKAAGGGGDDGGAGVKVGPLRRVVEAGADGKLPEVTWDLREGRGPAQVDWPKGQGSNNVYSLEGDFSFELKVQDKKDFHGRVRHVESRRSGGLIEGIEITAQPEGTEEAYARAKEMLTRLGFAESEVGKLEAWHGKARAGNYENLEVMLRNSYNRAYTVQLVNDGTSEQPWSVGLDIDWSKVCECHG